MKDVQMIEQEMLAERTEFEKRFDLSHLPDESSERVARLESILAVILGTLLDDKESRGKAIEEWYGVFSPTQITIPLPNKATLLETFEPYLTPERRSALEYTRQHPDIDYDY